MQNVHKFPTPVTMTRLILKLYAVFVVRPVNHGKHARNGERGADAIPVIQPPLQISLNIYKEWRIRHQDVFRFVYKLRALILVVEARERAQRF